MSRTVQTKHTTLNFKMICDHDIYGGKYVLYSYDTKICTIYPHLKRIVVTTYYQCSATTKRHLRWFFETLSLNIGVGDIRTALTNGTTINDYSVTIE